LTNKAVRFFLKSDDLLLPISGDLLLRKFADTKLLLTINRTDMKITKIWIFAFAKRVVMNGGSPGISTGSVILL